MVPLISAVISSMVMFRPSATRCSMALATSVGGTFLKLPEICITMAANIVGEEVGSDVEGEKVGSIVGA